MCKRKTHLSEHSLPEGLDKVEISEFMEINKSLKNFDVEIIPENDQTKSRYKKLMLREMKAAQTISGDKAPLSQIISYSGLV